MHACRTEYALAFTITCFTEEVALTSHGMAALTIVSIVRESLFVSF
jgi:hypothetical protein